MFVYSLAGLKMDGEALPDQELEDNETTARTGVYQLLARLLGSPDEETHAWAMKGDWPGHLADAGKLLPFAFSFGAQPIPEAAGREAFEADYLTAFEVGPGTEGPPVPLSSAHYGNDMFKRREEVIRFYEYFGLSTSAEDPRPGDHLATELEFMKFLTLKEAVSASPRLRASFQRAQHDFLQRQLSPWMPGLQAKLEEAPVCPFWRWAAGTAAAFVAADNDYVAGLNPG
jgi:DMSO reductase family type II enzyme chaperone